jgi:hypothetical protein
MAMNRFVLCHPLSSGSFWIHAAFFLLAVFLFFVFAMRVRRIPPGKEDLILNFKTRILALKGASLYLAVGLGMLVLIPYFSSIEHKLGFNLTPYPQHIDLNVKISLKTLRDKFEGYSNRVIDLDPAIEELQIDGEYEGACVADMFYAICLRNPGKLSCNWPWVEPVLYVKGKSP